MDLYNQAFTEPLAMQLDFTIEFDNEKQRDEPDFLPQEEDTPLTSCLRSRRHPLLSNTQHTVSTLASSSIAPSEHDDEDSICSADLFESDEWIDLHQQFEEDAIDKALRLSRHTASDFHHSQETFNTSLASFQDIHEEVEFVAKPDFNDSMGSLDAVSEKFHACIIRTSHSRRLIKQLSPNSPLVPTLSSHDSHRSLSQLRTQKSTLRRQDSARSLLLRSDSARSLSSMSNTSLKTSKRVSKAKMSYKLKMLLQRDFHREGCHRSFSQLGTQKSTLRRQDSARSLLLQSDSARSLSSMSNASFKTSKSVVCKAKLSYKLK
jgi:hypothetical protein